MEVEAGGEMAAFSRPQDRSDSRVPSTVRNASPMAANISLSIAFMLAADRAHPRTPRRVRPVLSWPPVSVSPRTRAALVTRMATRVSPSGAPLGYCAQHVHLV